LFPESFVIAFLCSHCGKGLNIKDEFAGKKGKCPHCGKVVLVPQKAAAPVTHEREEKTLPPGGQAGVQKSLLTAQVDKAPADPHSDTLPPRHPDKGSMEAGDTIAPGTSAGDREQYDFLAPPQSPDELGRLGPYRVLKVLGAGGMGVVFQAEDPMLKRKVALKAMLPSLAVSESARKRFLREAQTAAAIEHDNIVHIYQVGEDRGIPFMAMQFLKGESLDDRLKREGKLPLVEVVRIGREAAGGLVAAHATGLIHRDIKPANLWLETSDASKTSEVLSATGGRVKILDFGLARAAQDDAKLTQSGAIIGTPAYMAPEQANGQAVDGRTDLFSLGCVLYRLCTGVLPFQGKDTLSTLMAVAMIEPSPPRVVNPAIPRRLSDLVMRLLAKEPEKRPASADQLAAALASVDLSEKTVESPTVPLPRHETFAFEPRVLSPRKARAGARKSAKDAPRGRPPWLLPLAIGGPAVLVVVVILVVILSGSGGDGEPRGQVPPIIKLPLEKPKPEFPPEGGTLFNGKDLTDWEGLMEHWTFQDGVLTGSTTRNLGFNTFLCSKKEYGDFELECQVRLQGDKANSGLQFRSRVVNRKQFTVSGPQADMGVGYWGGLYGEMFGGKMKEAPPDAQQVVKEDDFNDYYVKVVGKHVTIKVNGRVTVDEKFPSMPRKGILAWQLHAGAPMTATIRNIRFRDLNGTPAKAPGDVQVLFNGKDLSGWVRKDGAPATWQVKDGYMEARGGDIKTLQKFGPDFQLHVEFWLPLMPNARGQARANSGVFLQGRHEVQILDSFDNPTGKAQGCGALFGLIEPLPGAIRPPEQWQTFDITFHAPRIDANGKLIARGRMDLVHNGIKVIDNGEFEAATGGAVDGRVGMPGPILLQDHGAPVRFRNIWIKELGKQEVRDPAKEPPANIFHLFNGQNFDGWEQLGKGLWTVGDEILRAVGDGTGWMATTKDYDNFELTLEYRLPAKGNSGVFLHAWKEGPVNGGQFLEIQLVDDKGLDTVGKVNGTAAIFGVLAPKPTVQTIPGKWHKLFIRSQGRRLQVSFDDQEVINTNLDDHKDAFARFPGLARTTGRIGLQQFGTAAEFRKIWLRPLPAVAEAGQDRQAAEWILKQGGKFTVEVKGQMQYVNNQGDMPIAPFFITRINLWKQNVPDNEWAMLSGLVKLEALELGQGNLTDNGLIAIKDLPQLADMQLGWMPITDRGVAYLKSFPALTSVGLMYTEVSIGGLHHLLALPNLQRLNLDGTSVRSKGLASLAGHPKLFWLELNHTAVGDAELDQLSRGNPGLGRLGLSKTLTTDKGLTHLMGLKGLRVLTLAETQITNEGLKSLGAMTSLIELNLSQTKISDTGLAYLKPLRQLTHLKLEVTDVTDAGLVHLQEMPGLAEVHLAKTQVTQTGAKKLRAALPKCNVLLQ
jgi:serine/threonine protein kinase